MLIIWIDFSLRCWFWVLMVVLDVGLLVVSVGLGGCSLWFPSGLYVVISLGLLFLVVGALVVLDCCGCFTCWLY